MKVILIAGKSGSGKTESANILKEILQKRNLKCAVTGFSKYLKLFAYEVLDWNGDDATKPRTFLQNLGMELRAIKDNLLINRMVEDMLIYKKLVDVVIISDVRMIDEVEYFKSKYNALTIKISNERPNRLSETEKKHITENELNDYDNFDYIIVNDEKLEEKLKQIVEEML